VTVPGATDGSVMVGHGAAPEARGPGGTDRHSGPVGVAVALAAWVALVVVARWVGRPSAEAWSVRSVPLMGGAVPRFLPVGPWVLAAGLVLAIALPWLCARLRWRWLLAAMALVAMAWGLALVLVRGPGAIDRSMANRHEYVAVVDEFDEIGAARFVDTFTDPDVLAGYPTHVQGHPLGATLVFVGLDRIGLDGPRGAVAFLLAASAVTAPAVLIAGRAVAGEVVARQAAPFLVLGPAAIWTATSADALFAAVGAVAVALVVVAAGRDLARSVGAADTTDRPLAPGAATGDSPPVGRLGTTDGTGAAAGRSTWSARRVALTALAGGAVFGAGVEISYGLVPLILIPVAVASYYRRWSVLAWAALGGVLVVGGAGLAGFWWFDGLAATRVRYDDGIAAVRPRGFFTFLGNPAAFALCLGPAAAVGLARLRDRRLALLVLTAVVAVIGADLSGLSKGEVERIWLPFAPWILLATGSLAAVSLATTSRATADRARTPRLVPVLLAAQVALAVAIESTIRTPW